MTRILAFGFLLAGIVAAGVLWHAWRARRLVIERLADVIDEPSAAAPRDQGLHTAMRPFPPRYRAVPPAIGVLAGLVLWLGVGVPPAMAAALGVLLGVLASLVETHWAGQQEALIETQLASAIDLLIGSLRAGASLLAAFESALQEADLPLRPYFQEVAGRIRLGDDPRQAVSDLQVRVPLETFRLFATSLVIHWEVGGSLATTLATVGRTVRDRIELSRRVRAQGVESHASVAVVLVISYLLAFLMWRTNPERLEAFVQTGIGTVLTTGVIALQAVGLVWMSRLSRSRF